MANNVKNVKKLNVNGIPYDIKDELLQKVVTTTDIGETTTTTAIKQEIETAATGTASTSGMTVKEALASLRQKIENKDVGVTDVSATVSTAAGAKKITLKQAKNGGTAAAISNAEIGTATLTIKKNNTNVATFGANAISDVTANIEVPTSTSQLTNDGETGASGEKYATESVVDSKITTALADITSFEYSTPYDSASELPATGEKGVVYLVADPDGVEGSNEYIEYIWVEDTEISGHYEMLGKHQIAIDDSNYAKLSTSNTQTFTGSNIFKGSGVTVNDGLTLAGYGSGASQHLSALTVGDKALIELNDNGEFDKIASGNTTLQDALDAKQDALTFDSTPTDGSTNPVTSDGIYDAIQTAIGTDKIHDYQFIDATVTGSGYGTFDLGSSITTSIKNAFDAKKVPVVNLLASNQFGASVHCPVVMTKYASGVVAEFMGSAFFTTASATPTKIHVNINCTSSKTYVTFERVPVNISTTSVNAVDASYANEVITFTPVAPLASAALSY